MLKLLDKSREINGTQPNYQDKIFRYKLKNIYRIVLCTIIVLAVILLIKLQIENRVYKEVLVTEEKERVGTETSVYTPFGDKLLVYSKDGISAYTEKGEQIFNQTYEMQNPLVSVNESTTINLFSCTLLVNADLRAALFSFLFNLKE